MKKIIFLNVIIFVLFSCKAKQNPDIVRDRVRVQERNPPNNWVEQERITDNDSIYLAIWLDTVTGNRILWEDSPETRRQKRMWEEKVASGLIDTARINEKSRIRGAWKQVRKGELDTFSFFEQYASSPLLPEEITKDTNIKQWLNENNMEVTE